MNTRLYMSRLILYATGLLMIGGQFACSRSKFAQINTNPDAVLSINPQTELTPGEIAIHSSSIEVFYDFVRNIKPWTQTYVFTTGNTSTFLAGANANMNERWSIFYGGVGDNLFDVMQIIDKMPATQQAQYQFMKAEASIPFIYYAFYVSDANGSIPYTQAFLARYTIPAFLTPIYNSQEALFDTLDKQLQSAIAVLESTPTVTQISPAGNDLYFGGDPTHWVKAANALRLKIAMRLMKVNPAKLTSIVNSVLADNVGLPQSSADEWILYSSTVGMNDNNNNALNQGNYSGSYNNVNFMWKTGDPRTRVFYQPAGITSADMLDSAEAQGQIPTSVTWDGQIYRGQYANPSASNSANSYMFRQLTFSYKGIKTQVYWPSIIQAGLTYATYNATTGGTNAFPLITYADVCFMRAELIARGLDNDQSRADSLYYQGIRASLMDYDHWAQITLQPDYTPLQYSEITNYLAQTGIVYNPATAVEQICDQKYLNYFVQPNETWALIKRTGFPAVASQILAMEDVSSVGVMPRRYAAIQPALGDLNYTNATNAIDSMALNPNYGTPSSLTGRVWWDAQ